MYRVTVKKSLQQADGSTTKEESQEEANHERHALNLAGRIARTDSVRWVEIEETTGRFKVRASPTRPFTSAAEESSHGNKKGQDQANSGRGGASVFGTGNRGIDKRTTPNTASQVIVVMRLLAPCRR